MGPYKMIENGRISLYDCIMHFYVHLIEILKNEVVKYKVSFVAVIIVLPGI